MWRRICLLAQFGAICLLLLSVTSFAQGVQKPSNESIVQKYLDWYSTFILDPEEHEVENITREEVFRAFAALDRSSEEVNKILSRFQKTRNEYQSSLGMRKWRDSTGKHQIEAKFEGYDGVIVVLGTPSGQHKQLERRKLHADDQRHIDSLVSNQQQIVLDATSLLQFVTNDEIVKSFPDVELSAPTYQHPVTKWRTVDGEERDGRFSSLKSGSHLPEPVVEVKMRDGEAILQLPISQLDKTTRISAKDQWENAKDYKRSLSKHDSYRKRWQKTRAGALEVLSERRWKESAEFAISKRAAVATSTWIDAQIASKRSSYGLAIIAHRAVVAAYVGGDKKELREAFALATPMLQEVHDLLQFSGYGNIYIRDAGGSGIHLTNQELWELATEAAVDSQH